MKTIAILTPTFNRSYILNNLFKSLCRQTSFDFKWYIIDDGSTDDTELLIKEFKTEDFEIAYFKKENGGKHTACNLGFSKISEELTFIVDSDDYLADDAIETIVQDWSKYKNEDVGGLSYHKMKFDGTIIGDSYVGGDVVLKTYIDMRINDNVKGDSAEVYRTDILKQFNFPEFKGEKFLSEAILWNKISLAGYKLVYISKGIYYCEYRNDGLTSKARVLQLKSPKGTMLHAQMHLNEKVKLKKRCKYMIMYIAMVKFAGVTYKDAFKQIKYKGLFVICFLPAILLKIKWRKMLNVSQNH